MTEGVCCDLLGVGALLPLASNDFVSGRWRRCMSTAPSERSQVTVRLDGPTWARLEREALQDRRPVASLARLLIGDALADRERQVERVNR